MPGPQVRSLKLLIFNVEGGRVGKHCSHWSYDGIYPHEWRQVLYSCSCSEIKEKCSILKTQYAPKYY